MRADLSVIRIFKFDLFMADKGQGPPENLASALAKRLIQMPQLQELVLVIPEHHTDIFIKTISVSKIILPAVHTLMAGPFCDFAVQLCPNVTTIANNGWNALHAKRGDRPSLQHTRDLIAVAGSAPRFENLEIMAWWEVDLVEAIHDSVPNLRRLALDVGSYKHGIECFIPVLSRLTDLEYLALGDASRLGVGFRPPGCGNAYRGPRGKEVRERIDLQRMVAERKVEAMVASACPRLKDLWIGDSTHVEVLRHKDGAFENYVLHRAQTREKVVRYPRP